MKIAFDVDVIKDLGITRMVHQVAEWGYKYIEQSPHPQINPFYKHPRASREIMAEYKQALRDTGLELSSFICVYRWSGPDELRRRLLATDPPLVGRIEDDRLCLDVRTLADGEFSMVARALAQAVKE